MDKFLVNGWPDDIRFTAVVTEIIGRANRTGRKVRVFGEMVALMWAEGHCGATVRLEHLWTAICQRESFPLFCAYPKTGFPENDSDSMARVVPLIRECWPSQRPQHLCAYLKLAPFSRLPKLGGQSRQPHAR